jgi:hypothetical protein
MWSVMFFVSVSTPTGSPYRRRLTCACRRGEPGVVVGLVDLLDARRLHQGGSRPLVGREDDPVGGPDADACGPAFDRLAGVLHLVEPTVG